MDLQVDRHDLHRTRVIDLPEVELEPGQARLRIASFALTANNITYAVTGDLLGYWNFFPAEDPWGRVPVWGFAEVIESRHDGLDVGRRVYGYLPMSDELIVTVGRIDESGFVEASPHRAPMAGAYNRYTFVGPADEAADGRRMVLHPLFYTAFLVDDFLGDNGFFGADTLVISSASSKTGLALAHQASRREGIEVAGLTSASRVKVVRGLGVHDRVVAYGEEDTLPAGDVVYVDISGAAGVRAAVRRKYGSALRHDMALGATHHDDLGGGDPAEPAPVFFFAPEQIAKRTSEWGAERLEREAAEAWHRFSAWVGDRIDLQRDAGPAAVAGVFLDLLDDQGDPTVGHVLSMHRPESG